MPSWIEPWRAAYQQPRFRTLLLVTTLSFTVFAVAFSRFVGWVDTRPGMVMRDPILERLPVVDLTWLTFGVLYAALPLALIGLIREPFRVLLAFQTWGSMLVLRIVAMYVTPLEPPEGIIPLVDPLAQLVFTSKTAPTHDLFFSGHTATLSILVLTAPTRRLALIFVAMTLVVITAMLLQRVHYAVDILVAPFFVSVLYRWLRPFYEPR